MAWAPVVFLPAPLYGRVAGRGPAPFSSRVPPFVFAESPFVPHYPAKSPLDDLFALAVPGSDEYIAEGYAAEILAQLTQWGEALRHSPTGLSALQTFLSPSIQSVWLDPRMATPIRSGAGMEVLRLESITKPLAGRDVFLKELTTWLAALGRIETADFEIFSCLPTSTNPLTVKAAIRYEFLGVGANGFRESRTGVWRTTWTRTQSAEWQAADWNFENESISRASGRLFTDVTAPALGGNDSYQAQLAHGADYWRTVLDGAIGVDVYGNNGVAVGDFDGDGLDDLYVCQPAGLPNRLYRNRGDGTFEDVTEQAGVGVLDFSACALFADFENRGLQDLLVVCATGPLLFVNDGKGKFSLKKDAFHFKQPPQGSFTHAAIADYDRDGRLDVYFCLYSYYQGLDQYRYPVPYFDARNGPPNFLFHNSGNWTFEDRTTAAGLNVENDRYSFASSWGDVSGDGWPDLYVVNDFGRNVLYRNNQGTFTSVSDDARVNEAGAGMSACWLDFDNDGKQDIYAAGMWVAAGMRIFEDAHFHPSEPDEMRSLYRRHMAGNSLYRNLGNGKFENQAMKAGVEMGRWSWSTDSWDFDHDGCPDLYVANGYISGLAARDVSSFFWRQVVAKSPNDSSPSPGYEQGWGAMNELIRSDSTWNGHERNVFLANNRDGTFSDISGIAGLDLRDDSRAFALADLDGDGRLEIVLKNRTAPQVRILRNSMTEIGNAIAVRLRGEKSNRDAIGAAVTVSCGSLRQTKYVQAGSGFLSQHTKELFFGLAENSSGIRANVRWPSGTMQDFENLPANHRIELREGNASFQSKAFAKPPRAWATPVDLPTGEILPSAWGTWLIEPVPAPEFSLPDSSGTLHELRSFQGKLLLLSLWSTGTPECREQLRRIRDAYAILGATGIQTLAINFDDPHDARAMEEFAGAPLPFPNLLATAEAAGIYNIVYRYLFDRHRDLAFPTNLLVDQSGNIVKVYQGILDPKQVVEDVASLPRTPQERMHKALPFTGTLHQDEFQRNAFSYGVAFFQHGFLDQAERAFQQVVAAKPEDAEAFYNLGTVYLRRNALPQAKENLEQAVKLRPNYPEAWNNLGMFAAQEGNDQEAIHSFEQSLEQRPAYGTALLNLGNLYRRKGDSGLAESLLKRAYANEPGNPEISYALGMLYARRSDPVQAEQNLRNAIKLRPDYADALNNLGVLLVQQQRYPEAESTFQACIAGAPAFDQAYLNLARLYAVLNDKPKAREVLQKLLQLQPQHTMAQQMLRLLY